MRLPPTKYNHQEAYCLMLYVSEDGLEKEILWNSRDGVTPFCIPNRDGTKTMGHTDWHLDRCVPNFIPLDGMRVFATISSQAEATARATKRVEDSWDSFFSQHFQSKAEAIEAIVKDYKIGETPIIKTIGLSIDRKEVAA